jgi:H+/Cl- antiporter ClcA
MAASPSRFPDLAQLRSWAPELLHQERRRFRAQLRLLALAALVGVVAGLGAVLFASACQLVEHYTLDGIAGYRTATPPEGEPVLFAPSPQPFRPWLLLVVPTVGGLLTGLLVYTAPTRSSRPITSSRGRCGRACRWSRSWPVR